jgi:hypothetical protein
LSLNALILTTRNQEWLCGCFDFMGSKEIENIRRVVSFTAGPNHIDHAVQISGALKTPGNCSRIVSRNNALACKADQRISGSAMWMSPSIA